MNFPGPHIFSNWSDSIPPWHPNTLATTLGEAEQYLPLTAQLQIPRIDIEPPVEQLSLQFSETGASSEERWASVWADDEVSPVDERSPSYSSDSQETWEVEIMYWPSKPAEDYLAWPPRVTRRSYRIPVKERYLADLTFNADLGLQRIVYGTERDWDFTSYYDMERSAWVTDMTRNDEVPIFKDRPLLLRHFTVQDHQCLGWEDAVEAAGFKVLRPILKRERVEDSSHKSKSNDDLDSRPTKRRRVSPPRSQDISATNSGDTQDTRRDRREHQKNDSGTSRGKPSWWMTISVGAVVTGLKEIKRLKGVDGRATLQQRFERAFPGKQFALSTVKRMIKAFNHLSEDDIERYLNEDSERPWSDVYALAK